ncbi:MAG: DUF2892 domain-containing protein [Ferruginibacter sp.]
MKKNLGFADQFIRIVLGLVLLVFHFLDVGSAGLSIFFLVLSIILLATSFFGFCPLYALFRIQTNCNEKRSGVLD